MKNDKSVKGVKVEIEKISAKDLAVIATGTSAVGGKFHTPKVG